MLPVGTVLYNRYRITRNLARGGMSNIYLCEDLRLTGKIWVIKEMAAQYQDIVEQQKAFEHFKREASILATLEHRNLPKVTDYFEEHGNNYFVMEYVEGEDLSNILAKSPGPLPERQVLDWGLQLTTVLYFLHCQKPNPIIFRDLKPSNIIVTGNIVKLIDFGIARNFSPTKKGDTMRIGSPGYAPPEQYSGQTDPRSDIFSLGVTLYQLLTKYDPSATQTPFKFPPMQSLNPQISPKLAQVIEKAIQIEPTQRYQNCIELKKDLQSCLGSDVTSPAFSKGPRTVQSPTLPYSMVPPQGQAPPQQPQPPVTGAQGNQLQGQAPSQKNKAPKQNISALKPKSRSTPFNKIAVPLLVVLVLASLAYLFRASVPQLWEQMVESLVALTINSPGRDVKYNKDFPEDLLVRKGIICLNRGDYKKVFESLDRVREEFSDDGEALLYLNNAYVLASGAENIIISIATKTDGSRAHPETREIYRNVALAQTNINKIGGMNGKKIQIVPRIIKDNGARLIREIRNLAEKTETLAFTGAFSDKDLGGLSEIMKKNERSLLELSYPSLTELPASIYSIAPPPSSEFSALATFIADTIKPRSIVILFNKDTQSNEKDAFKKAMTPDIKVHEFSYGSSDTGDAGLFADIIHEKPGLIVLTGTASRPQEKELFEKLFNKAKREKLAIPFLIREGLYYYWKEGGLKAGFPDALFSLLSTKPDEKSTPFMDYVSSYISVFRAAPPERNHALPYDAVTLIARAVEKKGSSKAMVSAYLEELGNGGTFAGASGTLTFNGHRCTSTTWWGIKRSREGRSQVLKNFQVK
jgi:serine/threonine protein kinase/ABC-type branched-subunit amino acid transport system substrate-binding protein